MDFINAREIASALGGTPSGEGWIAKCPAHDDRTPSLSVKDSVDGKVLVHCHAKCSQEAVITALRRMNLWPINRPEPSSSSVPNFKRIWSEAKPLNHPDANPAICYLKNRGLSPDPNIASLRFAMSLGYFEGKKLQGTHPAIIALATDKSGRQTGVHRIYISNDGKKAEVKVAKKALGKIKGSFVALDSLARVEAVAVAEGIETAMAVRLGTKMPTLSAISATGMRDLCLPDHVKEVHIWIDHDLNGTGEKAGKALTIRLIKEGRKVYIHSPSHYCQNGQQIKIDWLDVLNSTGEPAFGESLQKTPIWVPASNEATNSAITDERENYLAEDFLIHNGYKRDGSLTLRFWQKNFYEYYNGFYRLIPDYDLKGKITQWLLSQSKKGSVGVSPRNNVMADLEGLCLLSWQIKPPIWLNAGDENKGHYISCKNGILDLDKYIDGYPEYMMRHTPEYFSMSKLPFDFIPHANCPNWEAKLSEILPNPEVREFLQCWFGYNLLPDVSYHKMVFFVGEGANGKSVILTVLRTMLGEDNVSAVSLEAFNPNRTFALAATEGKLANIVEEIGESSRTDEGLLKQFVSGSPMTVERKYKDHFQLTPSAKLTFATNTFPEFKDSSDGIMRRVVIVPFTVQFLDESKQDKRLTKPEFWIASGEMSGIFNWAIAGLIKLLTARKFITPTELKAEKEGYINAQNPVKMFLQENYIERPGSYCNREAVYERYVSFCNQQKVNPLTSPNFARKVTSTFKSVHQAENATYHNRVRSRNWINLAPRQ